MGGGATRSESAFFHAALGVGGHTGLSYRGHGAVMRRARVHLYTSCDAPRPDPPAPGPACLHPWHASQASPSEPGASAQRFQVRAVRQVRRLSKRLTPPHLAERARLCVIRAQHQGVRGVGGPHCRPGRPFLRESHRAHPAFLVGLGCLRPRCLRGCSCLHNGNGEEWRMSQLPALSRRGKVSAFSAPLLEGQDHGKWCDAV